MCGVVVVAEFAERSPATLQLAIRTNRGTAVSTFSHGSLAARHTCVAVTGYVFDLAEWARVEITSELDSCLTFRLPAFFLFGRFLPDNNMLLERSRSKVHQSLGVGPSTAGLFRLAGARFPE